MFIPDVINTLLMGLIFIVIVVTVVRPIMLNLVHNQVDGDDIQKIVNETVNQHLMRHFQDQAAARTAEIRYQKLLLELPPKPKKPEPELFPEDEEEVPVAAAPVEEPVAEVAPVDTPETSDAEATTETAEASEHAGEGEAATEASAEGGDSAEAGEEEVGDGEIEIREGETLAEIKERMKKEQKQAKKPTIPPELLNNANSYEDKVGVVRMVVHADHSRVAALVRSMIKTDTK